MKILIIDKKQLFIFFLILIILVGVFLGTDMKIKQHISTFIFQYGDEPIRSGSTKHNKMAFTCNVDWGNDEIPKILDILDQKNIKITFFITGRWAKNNPELLKMIYERGHEIGNHGYGHKMHSKIDRQGNIDEIKLTEEIINNIISYKTDLFAPPSGDFNSTTVDVASDLGYKTILWSIDTIDWKEGSTSTVIIDRVMNKPHKGAILLMHPKPATVEALPYIIDNITHKGIIIGTVSQLIEK